MGGVLGTNFDSLLGTTHQSRKYLSNNGVNPFAILFGALSGGSALVRYLGLFLDNL
jgi:uncharacterized membrane protein